MDEAAGFEQDDRSNSGVNPRLNEEEEEEEEDTGVYSLTLEEFVSIAKRFLQSDDMANFSRFVLNGLHDGIQYQIDPIKNALEDRDVITALRDYDSILGIHDDICVTAPLTVYPVCKLEDTLCRNIHIKTSVHDQLVSLCIVNIIYSHSNSVL